MQCPKCEAQLQEFKYGETTVDRCDHCGGLWFDVGEAELLSNSWIAEYIDTGDAATGQLMDDVAPANCPRCGKLMQVHADIEKSQVFYEQCDDHGKFFDAGEFTLWASNQYL